MSKLLWPLLEDNSSVAHAVCLARHAETPEEGATASTTLCGAHRLRDKLWNMDSVKECQATGNPTPNRPPFVGHQMHQRTRCIYRNRCGMSHQCPMGIPFSTRGRYTMIAPFQSCEPTCEDNGVHGLPPSWIGVMCTPSKYASA